tara:strand:+ start:2854 stop:3312 length:459 start_codon:yes stop_codon:yes gene_type:complete
LTSRLTDEDLISETWELSSCVLIINYIIMKTLKGKIVSNGFYDVAVGTEVLVRLTEYGIATINIASTGEYLDKVDAERLDVYVELDKDESELQVKETITLDELGAMMGIEVVHVDGAPDRNAVKKGLTPFGYSVYTSGATRNSSVGCKTNKQ